jgi:hypothetical protein
MVNNIRGNYSDRQTRATVNTDRSGYYLTRYKSNSQSPQGAQKPFAGEAGSWRKFQRRESDRATALNLVGDESIVVEREPDLRMT